MIKSQTAFGRHWTKAGQRSVLDVACGPGAVTAAIAPRAASVVAFDATEQMLKKGQGKMREGRIAQRPIQMWRRREFTIRAGAIRRLDHSVGSVSFCQSSARIR
jgi:trans-aconitate methyltransferase